VVPEITNEDIFAESILIVLQVLLVDPHEFTAFTQIDPLLTLEVEFTVIEVVPCPLTIVTPLGTVHV
jgi:hypothetical protein